MCYEIRIKTKTRDMKSKEIRVREIKKVNASAKEVEARIIIRSFKRKRYATNN